MTRDTEGNIRIPELGALITEIRKVALEKPDFIYASIPGKPCKYSRLQGKAEAGKEPGCIVGHAFYRLGMTMDDLEELDSRADSAVKDVILQDAEDTDKWSMEEVNKLEWLAEVQEAQDNGSSWSRAVSLADTGRWRVDQ